MKPIIMFITDWCPHCKRASKWMEELLAENPKYSELQLRVVDEEKEPDFSKQYDYYYVPTYYLDGVKVHEGVASKEIIRDIFERSLI